MQDCVSRNAIHSPFFAQKSKGKPWFSGTWFSPPFLFVFLLSPPPYSQLFLQKPRFWTLTGRLWIAKIMKTCFSELYVVWEWIHPPDLYISQLDYSWIKYKKCDRGGLCSYRYWTAIPSFFTSPWPNQKTDGSPKGNVVFAGYKNQGKKTVVEGRTPNRIFITGLCICASMGITRTTGPVSVHLCAILRTSPSEIQTAALPGFLEWHALAAV